MKGLNNVSQLCVRYVVFISMIRINGILESNLTFHIANVVVYMTFEVLDGL